MADEFICDAPEVREFIGNVQRSVARTATVEDRLAAIRPYFSRLLEQRKWLPENFRRPLAAGGMGSDG